MGKHLYIEDVRISSKKPLEKIGHIEYLRKRIQFWKYRKKRTMGRPVLMLWRKS